MVKGGQAKGGALDPLKTVTGVALSRNFVVDPRLATMIQLLVFSRKHGEGIRGTSARYGMVCQSADREINILTNWAFAVWELLSVGGVPLRIGYSCFVPCRAVIPASRHRPIWCARVRRSVRTLGIAPAMLSRILRARQPSSSEQYLAGRLTYV